MSIREAAALLTLRNVCMHPSLTIYSRHVAEQRKKHPKKPGSVERQRAKRVYIVPP